MCFAAAFAGCPFRQGISDITFLTRLTEAVDFLKARQKFEVDAGATITIE
jgi:hypothetical protein